MKMFRLVLLASVALWIALPDAHVDAIAGCKECAWDGTNRCENSTPPFGWNVCHNIAVPDLVCSRRALVPINGVLIERCVEWSLFFTLECTPGGGSCNLAV